MRRRRRSIALAATLGAVLWASLARADDSRVHVVLVDGSEVVGELVEKVPGDHLTIQLATGEVRTIPWSSIRSTSPVTAPTTSPPPPPPPAIDTSPLSVAPTFGTFADKNDVPWPKPDRTPSFFEGDHTYLGLSSGIGTPVGYGGVVAAWDPVPYFELEGGVGLGGRFGYAASAMARFELPLRNYRAGIGLGLSANFLSSSDRAPGGEFAGAPSVARWLNFEFVEQSFAISKSGFFRFAAGFAFVLNRHDYDALCPNASKNPGSAGYDRDCVFGPSLPVTPKKLASDSHPPFVPYFGLELLWRLS
jgi:hypothetical protein